MSNGLAFPATAYALIGKSGLYLTVVICFMSVTSCGAGDHTRRTPVHSLENISELGFRI